MPPLGPEAQDLIERVKKDLSDLKTAVGDLVRTHSSLADFQCLIDELGTRGIGTVIVEGGGRLLGSLFDLDLVDKVNAYIAPVIIGGEDAPGPVGASGHENLAKAPRLERVTTEQLGPDTLVTGYVPGHTGHIPAGVD